MIALQVPPVVFQSVERPRRDDPGLPESAPEELLEAPGPLHEGGRTGQRRPHRSAQRLGKAHGHAVEVAGVAGFRNAGHRRSIPHSGAVEVAAEPRGAGGADDVVQRVQRPDAPASAVVGVLHAHQGRRGIQGAGRSRVRRTNRVPDLGRREDPALAKDPLRGDPGQRCRRPAFGTHDVGSGVHHHQVAGLGVGADGHLVGHGPRRHVDGGLLAQDLGRSRLEPPHGRVVAVDVVADGGVGHGFPHGRDGTGDGVAAQIDHAPTLPEGAAIDQARPKPCPSAGRRVRRRCGSVHALAHHAHTKFTSITSWTGRYPTAR